MTCCRGKHTNIMAVFRNCNESELQNLVEYLKVGDMIHCGWYLYCRTVICQIGEDLKEPFSEYLYTHYSNSRSLVKYEVYQKLSKVHDNNARTWSSWLYLLLGHTFPKALWDYVFIDPDFCDTLTKLVDHQTIEEKNRRIAGKLHDFGKPYNVDKIHLISARVSIFQHLLEELQTNSYSFSHKEIEDIKESLNHYILYPD